ncbi:MAG: DUF2341 domain-containing protein, partial [Sphaerochaeta sp.]|nr:DUF2341 domain-containing protein [Sphaerochaeta sp.]
MAFPYGWGRKCPITIDHTKVVGVPGEYQLCLTESNLPLEMLDALNANCANVDGSDIRVTSDAAGTTELARQVAYFDQSSGKASIIVKLPSISSAIDDVVWVWYNNASALEPDPTNANGQYSVYGSEFVGVYPLLKDANDSTLNQLNLLVTGSAVLAAGNGYDFNG